MENICEQCGTRNEPGVQFCVSCQAYLPWDDEAADPPLSPGHVAAVTVPAATAAAPADPTPVAANLPVRNRWPRFAELPPCRRMRCPPTGRQHRRSRSPPRHPTS